MISFVAAKAGGVGASGSMSTPAPHSKTTGSWELPPKGGAASRASVLGEEDAASLKEGIGSLVQEADPLRRCCVWMQ